MLHTVAVLQAYQADLLKDLDQGLPPEAVEELCRTTDFFLLDAPVLPSEHIGTSVETVLGEV